MLSNYQLFSFEANFNSYEYFPSLKTVLVIIQFLPICMKIHMEQFWVGKEDRVRISSEGTYNNSLPILTAM